MTNQPPSRTIKKLLIGDDGTITMRFKGASQLVIAQALDIKRDADGTPVYLCLDRLIHRPFEASLRVDTDDLPFSSLNVSGCVATELSVS